jgi:ABC-type antimicrobial peptide transport system permease subunit
MLIVSVVAISLLAGGYPAVAISRFSISGVLKGSASLKKPGIFRNSLIVAQFSAACVLMACTLIAYQQFSYMRNKPLGYNKEDVLSFPMPHQGDRDVLAQLRNRLSQQTSILSIGGADINLGIGKDGSISKSSYGFGHNGKSITSNWMRVDPDLLKTIGISVIKGRDFRSHDNELQGSVIVTESMAKQFEEKDPIGLTFLPDSAGPKYTIIGVIPDFHLYSLHEKTEPLLLELASSQSLNYGFVKTKTDNPNNTIKLIESTYKDIFPGLEFKGSFLDENTDRWYRKEKRLSLLLGTSAIIAILLSCLGLFAMALLMIQQRIKEIGVRKVLGASVLNINNLLAKDFLKLVVISLVISTPIAWWSMNNWLHDFPYHTTISWLLFVFVGLLAIVISVVTISFHTIKAALSNPIKSLRTE